MKQQVLQRKQTKFVNHLLHIFFPVVKLWKKIDKLQKLEWLMGFQNTNINVS